MGFLSILSKIVKLLVIISIACMIFTDIRVVKIWCDASEAFTRMVAIPAIKWAYANYDLIADAYWWFWATFLSGMALVITGSLIYALSVRMTEARGITTLIPRVNHFEIAGQLRVDIDGKVVLYGIHGVDKHITKGDSYSIRVNQELATGIVFALMTPSGKSAFQQINTAVPTQEMAIPNSIMTPASGFQHTIQIVLVQRDGSKHLLGSGWRYRDYLVTAYHVAVGARAAIEEGSTIELCTYSNQAVTTVSLHETEVFLDDSAEGWSPIDHLDIFITELPKDVWAGLKCRTNKVARALGQSFITIEGTSAQLQRGITSGQVIMPSPTNTEQISKLQFEHTATTRPSYSGAPIYNGAGAVVGMHLGCFKHTQVNYAVSVKQILDELDGDLEIDAALTSTTSQNSDSYNRRSDISSHGAHSYDGACLNLRMKGTKQTLRMLKYNKRRDYDWVSEQFAKDQRDWAAQCSSHRIAMGTDAPDFDDSKYDFRGRREANLPVDGPLPPLVEVERSGAPVHKGTPGKTSRRRKTGGKPIASQTPARLLECNELHPRTFENIKRSNYEWTYPEANEGEIFTCCGAARPVDYLFPPKPPMKLSELFRAAKTEGLISGIDAPRSGPNAEKAALRAHTFGKKLATTGPSQEKQLKTIEAALELYPKATLHEQWSKTTWDPEFDAFLDAEITESMKSINLQSSPGFPHTMKYPQNKSWYENPTQAPLYEMTALVKERIHALYTYGIETTSLSAIALVENGFCDPCKMFIKDELHKDSKINSNKLRMIWMVSVIDQIVERVLFRQQNSLEIALWDEIPSKPGMGFSPSAASSIYLDARKRHRQTPMCDTDVSAWDMSVPAWLYLMDLEARRRLAGVGLRSIWYRLARVRMHCLLNSVLLTSDGALYQQNVPGLQKSGTYLTSSSNSRMRWMLANLATGATNVVTMGDDALEEHHEGMVDAYASLGFNLKDSTPFREVGEEISFSFCSHTFEWNHEHHCPTAVPGNDDKIIGNLLNYKPVPELSCFGRWLDFQQQCVLRPDIIAKTEDFMNRQDAFSGGWAPQNNENNITLIDPVFLITGNHPTFDN